MKISQQIFDIRTATPRAALVLENMGDVTTYHEEYGARHPLGSYNVSLSHVSSRILAVLDVLEETQRQLKFDHSGNATWEIPLLEATDHMLDALLEHLDDCGGIIRSFFPASNDKRFKKVHSDFKRGVRPYRDHIGKIVNYIKHNQGRLRGISFRWANDSALGYYVEGPVTGGGLGPVAIVHPSENTAFSYNRDMRYHVCSIYAVSANLATALHSADSRLIAPTRKKDASGEKQSDMAKILSRVASMPLVFFEDELRKGVPIVDERKDRYELEYPARKRKPQSPPGGAQVRIAYRGDGVTKSFRMPYYKTAS